MEAKEGVDCALWMSGKTSQSDGCIGGAVIVAFERGASQAGKHDDDDNVRGRLAADGDRIESGRRAGKRREGSGGVE